ncbi:MAG: hypothetical protein AAF921_15050 [Cyanobacteria bacterium P01_D01_bin.44]
MCAICTLSRWGSLSTLTSSNQRQQHYSTLHYLMQQHSSTDAGGAPAKPRPEQERQFVSSLRRKLS